MSQGVVAKCCLPKTAWPPTSFSYDDGVFADKRFAAILDKYGLKCTFNLNSGLLRERENASRVWGYKGKDVSRLPIEDMLEAYKNHEVAVHGYSHPHLEELCREFVELEINTDMRVLEKIFGKRPVGMAYPFGSFNDTVVDVLRESAVKYARTVRPTHNFDMQSDLLQFNPTCHHNDERLFELAEKFVNAEPTEPMLFFVWGHTYEFDGDDNWDMIERFCEYVSGRDDIYYCTNAEALL